MELQNVDLKLTEYAYGSIKVSNLKLIDNIVTKYGLTGCNPTTTPNTISADQGEPRACLPRYQSGVTTLRIVPDITHPPITWILGTLGLGGLLHNPAILHEAAAKLVLR